MCGCGIRRLPLSVSSSRLELGGGLRLLLEEWVEGRGEDATERGRDPGPETGGRLSSGKPQRCYVQYFCISESISATFVFRFQFNLF